MPVPPPPEGLTEREQRWWARLAAEVDPLEVYTRSDAATFLSLVRLEALGEAALDGESVDADREGNRKPASLNAISALARTTAMLRQRFRLDPASRGAVAAPPTPERDGPDPDDLESLDGDSSRLPS